MKAQDWEFEKIIPDEEDCKAACKSSVAFINLPILEGDEVSNTVDTYHSGFMRGLAWAKAKYNIKD